LKATKSASGIIGTFLGPRSPGTGTSCCTITWASWMACSAPGASPRGGTGAVSEAIASAARGFGAEIRCDAPVARVLVKGGRATGVALENGDEISAKVVVSGLDPRRTFLQLVEEPNCRPTSCPPSGASSSAAPPAR